ncbi:MAG TPA: alpha/beta hydrolase [Ktedonobacterales bacterium]
MSAGIPFDDRTPPRSNYPLRPNVRSRTIGTDRLRQHYYTNTTPDGERVLLVHGNSSSARFFEGLIASLTACTVVAPDLRGYGASEREPVDAERGLRDFSDDLESLVTALGWETFHLLGWSLGGNIVMQYAIDHPERIKTLTLHATGSPYGYGGTKDERGMPNYADFAGSGGGLISPEVVVRFREKDFTADSPFSPRSALRNVIVKPTYTFAPDWEDALVEQMLMMVIGEQFYPGNAQPSNNWPMSAPGDWGANNALSPKYCNLSGLATIAPKPPILWLRGADDLMVSDAAAVDPAYLGQLGVIPGWPGADVCPPQPMLRQIRAVLDAYRADGGRYDEVVFEDCGHSPLIEKPERFLLNFRNFIAGRPLDTPAAPTPAPELTAAAEATQEEPAPESQPEQRRGPFDWFRRRS